MPMIYTEKHMKTLTVTRPIDAEVYNQFQNYPFWISTLETLRIGNIKTAVDVGASTGIFLMFLLGISSLQKIYCFEPDEENFKMLQQNADGLGEGVDLYNIGIYYGLKESGVVGTGDQSPLGYMVDAVKKDHDFRWGTTPYEGKKFKLTTLEKVIKTPVDLIKLDVEGSEYNIVENSTLLRKSKYLQISFHNHPGTYVENFLHRMLPEYSLITFESSGDYSESLLRIR